MTTFSNEIYMIYYVMNLEGNNLTISVSKAS